MIPIRAAIFTIGLTLLSATVFGQAPRTVNESVTVPFESAQTKRRLAEIQDKIRTGKADEALMELQSIIDLSSNDLVSTVSTDQLIPANRVAHALIATLPETTFRGYRNRIDSAANALFERAKRQKQTALIEELIDRYFHAKVTAEALAFLGELQFERAEFHNAELTWRRLNPSEKMPGWHVKDEPKDPAFVNARITLAVIRQGQAIRSEMALEQFREKFATAKGSLAGQKGIYLDILKDIAKSKPFLSSVTSPRGAWNSLGGEMNRDGLVHSRMPAIWPSGPTWRTKYSSEIDFRDTKSLPETPSKSVPQHPVILNGYVYLADAGRIYSFELSTGRSNVVYDLRDDHRELLEKTDRDSSAKSDFDFCLTSSNGHLYVRLGQLNLWTANANGENEGAIKSAILRFTPKGGDRLKPDWIRLPPGLNGTVWEGSPAIANGRLYAATGRSDGGRFIQKIVCFDEASNDPIWDADVTVSSLPQGEQRTRHELVTISNQHVIFNTQSGAVIALHATTGKPAWTVKYQTIKPSGKALVLASAANHRAISPPVVSNGIVFSAPSDCETIFGIEELSGRVLWEKKGLRTESIIGVSRNKLIVTLAGPVRGIRAFDVFTGSDEFPLGWKNHDDPGLASLGRGILSDDQILWPTRGGLFAIRPQDGRLARPPILGPHGNLAFAEGTLIAVNPSEVIGYVIPDSARQPRQPTPDSLELPNRIDIAQVPSILPPPPAVEKPLPPVSPREITKTIPIEWAQGVLPGDDRAGIWLIGNGHSAAVSKEGEIGEKISLPFEPTFVTAIGRKVAFSNDSSIYRPDSESIFHAKVLSEEVEPLGTLNVGYGVIAVLVGVNHLACLDAVTLQLKWIQDASGRFGYWPYHQPSEPRFGPYLLVSSSGIIAQTLTGQMKIYDSFSGKIRYSLPTTSSPWQAAPALLEDTVIAPLGPGRIFAFDPIAGDRLWEYSAENESGLSGVAPRIWLSDGKLFVGITRNHGLELQYVAGDTGRAKWRRAIFLTADSSRLTQLEADGSTVMISGTDFVEAIRIIDGRPIWKKILPYCEGGWRMIIAVGGVILSPKMGIVRGEESPFRAMQSWLRFPDPRRLIGILLTICELIWDRTIPLKIFNRTSGESIRTIEVPSAGIGIKCQFHPTGGVVGTAGKVYLLK